MSTIKSSSEDLTLNADGSGNDIKFQSNGVEKASLTDAGVFTATSFAGSGANLTGLPAAGDKRNYILDGNFSQWPEGTTIVQANDTYGHLFWKAAVASSGAAFSAVRSTDVPTVGESKHQSQYSMQMDCTTADASLGSGELFSVHTHITGYDYQHLHGQEVTLAFWVKATVTGTSCVYFQNSARNRSYVSEFTISSTDTWEYKTITLTLDTTGTWLFDEGIGLRIGFALSHIGSDYQGTNNSWEAARDHATSNQVNHASSTSNNFRIAQIGLYLGSSAPDHFLSEDMSVLQQKISFYFRYSATSLGVAGHGSTNSTGSVHWINSGDVSSPQTQ